MIRTFIQTIAPARARLRVAKQLGMSLIAAIFFGLFAVTSTRVGAQSNELTRRLEKEFQLVHATRPYLLHDSSLRESDQR